MLVIIAVAVFFTALGIRIALCGVGEMVK